MIIIGEKINGSIPAVAEAIARRDAEFIKQRAIAQAEAGAAFIDCCASVPEDQEVETLRWMIGCIESVTDLPIALDSPSADVLAQAYKFCSRPGLINSVSGEGDKLDKIFLTILIKLNCFLSCHISILLINSVILLKWENVFNIKLKHIILAKCKLVNESF